MRVLGGGEVSGQDSNMERVRPTRPNPFIPHMFRQGGTRGLARPRFLSFSKSGQQTEEGEGEGEVGKRVIIRIERKKA